AEGQTFPELHLYVCIALLLSFRNTLLRQDDFQSLMIFLQSLPTKNWQNQDITIYIKFESFENYQARVYNYKKIGIYQFGFERFDDKREQLMESTDVDALEELLEDL
ncbi:hypothetical protein GJ496_009505, partial [Pomphorhynchus laevis]